MSKPKLYLFAIGGTGSRVLYNLTMLLSTGVKVNVEKIIPMIIDTDINNGDVEKCRSAIKNYASIHDSIYNGVENNDDQGNFFRTQILPPKELNISGTDYGTLHEMVDYNSLKSKGHQSTQNLMDLLYSESNKEMDLEKGFLGNPNVGSIVLKNVTESKKFKEFTQEFREGDRIFIISSIFGGTGAAGFPLLLNVFRNQNSSVNNGNIINNAIIGGVSVLPYFQVDVEKFNTGESAINSNTFITKTKAALAYYNKNLKHLVNALYFVGDTRQSSYPNFDGGIEQKNPANFIELSAAESVLEFMGFDPSASTKEDLATESSFFEYGIKEDTEVLNLKHLKQGSFTKQFIKYHYYNMYTVGYLENALKEKKLAWKNEFKLPDNYYNQNFIEYLKVFSKKFYFRWLYEFSLHQHNRKFLPFDLSVITNLEELSKDVDYVVEPAIAIEDKDLFTAVTGIPAEKGGVFSNKRKIKYDQVFSELAKQVVERQLKSKEHMVSTLLNEGVAEIIEKHYSF